MGQPVDIDAFRGGMKAGILESVGADGDDAVAENDVVKRGAAAEAIVRNLAHGEGQIEGTKPRAVGEGRFPKARDRFRNLCLGNAFPGKGPLPDRGQGVGRAE